MIKGKRCWKARALNENIAAIGHEEGGVEAFIDISYICRDFNRESIVKLSFVFLSRDREDKHFSVSFWKVEIYVNFNLEEA